MGELHLEIIIDRLKREFKVDAILVHHKLLTAKRLPKEAEVDYTHKKQSGGAGQFARIKLIFSPSEDGFEFKSRVVGGSVPREYIPGVEKGLQHSMGSGCVAGFPVINVAVELIDGAYHDVDSSVMAFEIGRPCRLLMKGMRKASPKLLEPVMKVEVVTPEEYMGDIIGDLNSRRGQVSSMEQRGIARVVSAMVPLATMFGYVNNLRSFSQGRAQYSMVFDHYEPVPQAVADEVRAKLAG